MRADSSTVRRRYPARNGTTRSSRSGRSRSADGPVDDVDMRASPLIRRVAVVSRCAVAGGGEADVGHEVGEHDLLDSGLAERRQDAFDVAQEDPVRPDDEDALVLEREAVGVQQVGGPVEGDHRLAGAGTRPGRRGHRHGASG